MSNNPYEQRRLFCQETKMKKLRIKISIIPGLSLGIVFPMEYYTDISISILFININIKWRKR
jgi:hypothetical protein